MDKTPQQSKQELPKQWLENPQMMQIAADHQHWLASKTSQQMFRLLERWKENEVERVGCKAATPSTSNEEVRITAAQIYVLQRLQKVIYDTEEFVKAVTGGR